MGLLNVPSQKPIDPYKDEGLNKIYNLLFCDNIESYKSQIKSAAYPWNDLFSSLPDINKLQAITRDPNLESRQQILAFNLLTLNGSVTKQKILLGVIVEVALSQGLDVLASFKDGTARYINYSEKLLVWETQTDQSSDLTNNLFSESLKVVHNIGPWDKERKPIPKKGMVRLTFLVSNGLYFGEGPFDVLQNDAMGGPVINAATELMAYLTEQNNSEVSNGS